MSKHVSWPAERFPIAFFISLLVGAVPVANAGELNVTSTGVGIGTSSPSGPLHIIKDSHGEAIRLSSSPYGIGLDGSTVIVYANATYSAARVSLGMLNASDWTYKKPLVVSPDGTAGRVGINTPTPSCELDVTGTLKVNGTVLNGSDIRLKRDVEPLENSLDRILRLEGISYNWKDEKLSELGRQIGLSAQNVEEVFPDVVKADENGTKAIAYNQLIAPIIEAVKEQNQIINSQKIEIEALKSRLSELESMGATN